MSISPESCSEQWTTILMMIRIEELLTQDHWCVCVILIIEKIAFQYNAGDFSSSEALRADGAKHWGEQNNWALYQIRPSNFRNPP